jgi:uncharacterized membrane protein YoaK (UPF0700 family)
MATPEHPPLTRRRIAVAVVLSLVAGFVDVFSFLVLSGIYTATMSGNTVLIAVHGGAGQLATAWLHATTIAAFVIGLMVSSIAIEIGLRHGIARVLALALTLEATCLAVIALWGVPLIASGAAGSTLAPRAPLYLLVGLSAIAMGTQNTSLRMAGILSIFTTHVTGTLTRFGEQLVNYGFALSDQLRRGAVTPAAARPAASLHQAAFSAALWVAFLAGAGAASTLTPRWGAATALCLPIALLALVAGIDLLRPLAKPRT